MHKTPERHPETPSSRSARRRLLFLYSKAGKDHGVWKWREEAPLGGKDESKVSGREEARLIPVQGEVRR